ncbi:DNA primase [bacterium]|nr:DNA primase [bacterium]
MPAFSQSFLDRVKAANPISDVIGERIALTKNGKNFKACCPFHHEKTPSFYVTPGKEIFKCFGCGKGGSVFNFLMEYEGLSFQEAVIKLAERANIPLEGGAGLSDEQKSFLSQRQIRQKRLIQLNQSALNFFQRQLSLAAGKEAQAYLQERRVSPEAVRAYRLGFAPDSWDDLVVELRAQGFRDEEMVAAGVALPSQEQKGCYNRFRKRVMFPIWDHASNLVAFGGRSIDGSEPKYLNTTETEVYTKSKVLFSLNFAKNAIPQMNKTAILCEGYLDVVMLAQNGFVNALASCGTSLTQEQAHLIKRFANTCLIAYDGDQAGQKAALRAIPLLSEAGLLVYVVPLKENEDPDSFLKKYGREEFQKLIDQKLSAFAFAMRSGAKEKDMSEPQERYALCHEMFPFLLSASSEGLRQELIRELSSFSGVPASSISIDFENYRRQQSQKKERKSSAPEASPEIRETASEEGSSASTAERHLIAMLFSIEDAMDYIFDNLELEAIKSPLAAKLAYSLKEEKRDGRWHGTDDFLRRCDDDSREFITGVLTEVPLPKDAKKSSKNDPFSRGSKDAAPYWKNFCDDCIRVIKAEHYQDVMTNLDKQMKMTSDPETLKKLLETHKIYSQKKREVNRIRTFDSMAKEAAEEKEEDDE